MAWYERDYHREESRGGLGNRLTMFSVVTWLLILNTFIWLWDEIFGPSFRAHWMALGQYMYFSWDKSVVGLQFWRWFTFQFVHADFWHLLFNMIGLYFFGPIMERWWGSRRFLAFYLFCGAVGAVAYVAMSRLPGLMPDDGYGVLIGASGGLFGILVGCAVVAPNQRVMLLFPPIPMSMRTMALVFLGIAVVKIIVGHINAGGEAAHLGGAILGFFLVKNPRLLNWTERLDTDAWRSSLQRRRRQRERNAAIDEQQEVDRILDKVRQHGLQSLTRREKKTLNRATERQRRAG